MKASDDVVFLLDVDNTLLDNDRVQDDLSNHLDRIGDLLKYDFPAMFRPAKAVDGKQETT